MNVRDPKSRIPIQDIRLRNVSYCIEISECKNFIVQKSHISGIGLCDLNFCTIYSTSYIKSQILRNFASSDLRAGTFLFRNHLLILTSDHSQYLIFQILSYALFGPDILKYTILFQNALFFL